MDSLFAPVAFIKGKKKKTFFQSSYLWMFAQISLLNGCWIYSVFFLFTSQFFFSTRHYYTLLINAILWLDFQSFWMSPPILLLSFKNFWWFAFIFICLSIYLNTYIRFKICLYISTNVCWWRLKGCWHISTHRISLYY